MVADLNSSLGVVILTQMINDFLSKSIQLGSYVLTMQRILAVLLTLDYRTSYVSSFKVGVKARNET